MRYAPDVFWGMAYREFILAVEGYAESKGAKTKKGGGGRGGPVMTSAELDELAKDYPDTPVPDRRAA